MSNDNSLLYFTDHDYTNHDDMNKLYHLYIILPSIHVMTFYDENGREQSSNTIDSQTIDEMKDYNIYSYDDAQPWAKNIFSEMSFNNDVVKTGFGGNNVTRRFKMFYNNSEDKNIYRVDRTNCPIELTPTLFKDLYIPTNGKLIEDRSKIECVNSVFFPLFVTTNTLFFSKAVQNRIRKYDARVDFRSTNLIMSPLSTMSNKVLNNKIDLSLHKLRDCFHFILSRNSFHEYNIIEFSFDTKNKMHGFEKFLEKEFDIYNAYRYTYKEIASHYSSMYELEQGGMLGDYNRKINFMFTTDGFYMDNDYYFGGIALTGSHIKNNPSSYKLKKVTDFFTQLKENHSYSEIVKLQFVSLSNTPRRKHQIIVFFNNPETVDEYNKIMSLIDKGYIECIVGGKMKQSKNFKPARSNFENKPFVIHDKHVMNRMKIDRVLLDMVKKIQVNTDCVDEIYEQFIPNHSI